MESIDLVDYQRSTVKQVARTCQPGNAIEPILHLLQQLTITAEAKIATHSSDRTHIDCGPGCSSCCVVNVSTLMPEGIAIARSVRQQGRARSTEVVARLEALWAEVRGLDDDDRLILRRNCAFLDKQGCCAIYPERPLLCRSVTSTSAQRCRDALTGKVLGEETMVLMHQFQQTIYEVIFTGLAAGLEECGLDGRSFQLTGLVRYLLKYPEAEHAWLAGERLTWQAMY